MRRILAVLGLVALAVAAWLSVQVYRARTAPEEYSGPSWILGPDPRALDVAAREKLTEALEALNDTRRPGPERLATYRSHLEAAERLLVRSLEAQPAQAWTLARLAAVRFELDPPVDEAGRRKFMETIDTAAALAPASPRVQKDLGVLLCRMGNAEAAFPFLSRAIELDPTTAREAVTALGDALVTPADLLLRLPRKPEVLVAAYPAFAADGSPEAFLDSCEREHVEPTPGYLRTVATAALAAKDPARLARFLESTGVLADTELEAERLALRSRAKAALDDRDGALADAAAARKLRPSELRHAEHYGNLAAAAGRRDEALAAYREALALAVRQNAAPSIRARLYASIGRGEEAASRLDRAYDAYKKAVEADPAEPWASKRLKEMGKAAGF